MSTTDDLHLRLAIAIEGKLRAPNGDKTLTAVDFASLGEIAHEAADAIEAEFVQVGWWLPDDCEPERMARGVWEEQRIVSLWTVEDQGGFVEEWEGRRLPVFIARAVGQVVTPATPEDTK